MKEIYLGNGTNLTVQASKNVELKELLVLKTGDKKSIELEIKIIADFDTIPEEYHEVFMNMLTAKYYNTVAFSSNPFSQCVEEQRKKWWQIWK